MKKILNDFELNSPRFHFLKNLFLVYSVLLISLLSFKLRNDIGWSNHLLNLMVVIRYNRIQTIRLCNGSRWIIILNRFESSSFGHIIKRIIKFLCTRKITKWHGELRELLLLLPSIGRIQSIGSGDHYRTRFSFSFRLLWWDPISPWDIVADDGRYQWPPQEAIFTETVTSTITVTFNTTTCIEIFIKANIVYCWHLLIH